MKQCKCGSYAINIERDSGENCEVCHYRIYHLRDLERLLIEFFFLRTYFV
jgi:hypothetical protein